MKRLLVVLMLFPRLAFAGGPPSSPITLVVTTVEDDMVGCPALSVAQVVNVPTLRCAITRANGHTGFADVIEFNIPAAGCPSGICTIVVDDSTPLPPISEALEIHGRSETVNALIENPVEFGGATRVGVHDATLAPIAGPTVQIVDGGGHAWGLKVTGNDVAVSGLAISGFGNMTDSDNHALIYVTGSGFTLEDSVLGRLASGGTPSDASAGDILRVKGGAGATISGCELALGTSAVVNAIGAPGLTIEDSVLFNGNSATGAPLVNIRGAMSTDVAITGSSIGHSGGSGITTGTGVTGVVISGDTLWMAGQVQPRGAIHFAGDDNRVEDCRFEGSAGAAVMVAAGASGNTITRNEMSGNGTADGYAGGIDRLTAGDTPGTGTAPYVTPNDVGDVDGITNFPVLEAVVLNAGKLEVAGFARPGATLEIFAADPSNGFGEPYQLLAVATEGAAADLDDTVDAYDVEGAGADSTHRFEWRATPALSVAAGDKITGTATVAGDTSEAGPNATVELLGDLEVGLTGPATVNPLGEATFTASVTNHGPAAAKDPTVTFFFAGSTDHVVGTAGTGWSCAQGTESVVCASAGPIANGASSALTLTVIASAQPGFLEIGARARSVSDARGGNNRAEVDTVINQVADLAVSLADAPDPVAPGATFTLTTTVENLGPSPAQPEVELAITYAGAYTVVPGDEDGWSCELLSSSAIHCARSQNLFSGTTTFTLAVTPAAAGTFATTATVMSGRVDDDPTNDTASASTTVTGSGADLSVAVGVPADPARIGMSFAATATVANAGPQTATGVSLLVAVDAGATVTGAAAGWTCDAGGSQLSCTRASVVASETVALTVVAPATRGVVGITATVDAATADPDPTDDTAAASVTIYTVYDIGVELAGTPEPVLAGGPVTYVATATGFGPDPGYGSLFVDATTVGTVVSASAGCSVHHDLVNCSINDLAAGLSRSVTVTVMAAGAPGVRSVTATFEPGLLDTFSGDDSATIMTTVAAGAAELAVTLVDSPDPVVAGGTLSYSVGVTNGGTIAADDVSVAVTVPAGAVVRTASGTGWTCAGTTCGRSSLAAGSSAGFTVVVTAPVQAGAAVAGVTASAAGVTGATAGATTDVVAATKTADLALTLAAPATVAAGGVLAYTLAVDNAGPDEAPAPSLGLTLPSGAAYVDADGAGWSCAASGAVVTCGRAALAAGASSALAINATAPAAAGPALAVASIGSGAADPVAANDTATATTAVTTSADLSVALAVSPGTIALGGALTVTATVHNEGPQAAEDVSVVLAGLSGTVEAPGWTCTQSAGISCARATLLAGQDGVVAVTVTPAAAGTFSATAVAESATADPDGADLAASASATVTSGPIPDAGPGSADAAAPADARPAAPDASAAPDGGVAPADAGANAADSGTGSPDAGPGTADGGTAAPDGAVASPDAGVTSAEAAGCACRTGGRGGPGAGGLLLVGLVLVLSRRGRAKGGTVSAWRASR